VAVTRYYDVDPHAPEKARVDSVWKAVYADVGSIPIVISTASMVRYGCSSTPTFVFIDRKGRVSWYTPTRLTGSRARARGAADRGLSFSPLVENLREASVGLCFRCRHARTVKSRTSLFWRCELSQVDPHFDKYPRLPVLECSGYTPRAPEGDPGHG
jgi:hypothetical protein